MSRAAASPILTLAALLAAAALVLGGGWHLARRTVEDRRPPDRAVLREVSRDLQVELLKLETLFQKDVHEVLEQTPRADDWQIRRLADTLHGLLQYSELTAGGAGDRHLALPEGGQTKLPAPVLGGLLNAPHPGELVLSPEEATPSGAAPDFGWFVPSDPRYWLIWNRGEAGAIRVFLVDQATIRERVDAYLREWLGKHFQPVRASRNLVRVEGPGGASLAETFAAPTGRAPDFILPIISRFGDWQVTAWDRIESRTVTDSGVLTLAATVSAALALLGAFLFVQQRRAALLAEQRVSFVNRVSHELGAPLTNILLNLDLIEDTEADLPETARRRLRMVREEAGRLGRLVGNVLTFSRGERRQIRLHPTLCAPDEVIRSVLEQFAPALERRGIDTRWDARAADPVLLDRDALAQIVANLVSNVEKYAASGKRLDLASEQRDGWLRVRISDAGPGIPAAEADRIFRPFERLDSRTNEGSTGAGLGLSIARELAELMGGSLRLADSPRGARFELSIPSHENPAR